MRPSVPEGIAAAVAAIVLVVAIVGVATRDTSKASVGQGPPVATAQPPSAQAPATVPGATAPEAHAPAGGGGVAPADAPRASGADGPSAPMPPTPGRYDYVETDSNGPRDSTLEIAAQGGGHQTENTDSGSTIDEVTWGPSGKVETATTFSFPSGSFRCVWSPSFVEYKFPLRVGSSWTAHTICRPNAQSSIALDGTSRVVASERRLIGGTTVDAWIIVTDATIKFTGNGMSFNEAIRDEDHFAPAFGITVHEIADTTDTGPAGQQNKDRSVRDLKSLKPARTS